VAAEKYNIDLLYTVQALGPILIFSWSDRPTCWEHRIWRADSFWFYCGIRGNFEGDLLSVTIMYVLGGRGNWRLKVKGPDIYIPPHTYMETRTAAVYNNSSTSSRRRGAISDLWVTSPRQLYHYTTEPPDNWENERGSEWSLSSGYVLELVLCGYRLFGRALCSIACSTLYLSVCQPMIHIISF